MTNKNDLPPFDIRDVEAAANRAAWKAVHGAREDKAGRFAPEPKASSVKENTTTPYSADTKPKR